ncbi:hypothetical protein JXA85_00600 [Candidatus Woesearchaeota archaeon]|nr:hypothetical protein [Candidatus Woesearchaeota archaeon]
MPIYKSKGEAAIADVLTKYNIEFEYEYPVLIKEQKKGDTEKLRIWYPDFWLPAYSIIIEYWGKEGDPAYEKGKAAKLAAYKNLHISCISVKPSTIKKDLKSYLLIKIKTLINDRVRYFENRNK